MNTVIQHFFSALGRGGVDAALDFVDPQAIFVAVRPKPDPQIPLYGTYHGHDGVRRFVTALGETFETELFEIDNAAGDETVEFARGRLRHRVRASGRVFACDWAVACRVRDGRLLHYQFFEDTAALGEALKA